MCRKKKKEHNNNECAALGKSVLQLYIRSYQTFAMSMPHRPIQMNECKTIQIKAFLSRLTQKLKTVGCLTSEIPTHVNTAQNRICRTNRGNVLEETQSFSQLQSKDIRSCVRILSNIIQICMAFTESLKRSL